MAAKRRALTVAGILSLGVVCAAGAGLAAKKVSPLGWGAFGAFEETAGVAAAGIDVIAARNGNAMDGTDAFTSNFGGVTWKFSSAKNRDKFNAAPARYAPHFGGFCAFAVSKGFTAKADPHVTAVVDDKLLFFADADVKEAYLGDLKQNLKVSHENWSARSQ